MSSDSHQFCTSQQTPKVLLPCARRSGYRELRATAVPIPRAPNPVGETEVFSKYCGVIFRNEHLVWISTGRKVEHILGCRLGLGRGMEVGKGRTYLKTARGSSVVESEDWRVRSRERRCERMCWHKHARASKMTCSKLDFIQRGASRGSGRASGRSL